MMASPLSKKKEVTQEEMSEADANYGWKVKLDHEFVSKAGPLKMIRAKQIPSLLSTFFRYRYDKTSIV